MAYSGGAVRGARPIPRASNWAITRLMARKKVRKEAAAHAARGNGRAAVGLPVKISVEITENTPSFYVNYAEVSFAAHELALSLVRVPTKLSGTKADEAKTGVLRCESVVQVLFAPTLLPGLIRALTTTKESYEETIG